MRDHIEYHIKPDVTNTTNDVETAEVHISSFFTRTYIQENTSSIPDFSTRSHDQINSVSITKEDLLQKLSKLNTSKAMGPDKVHALIMKKG